MIKTRTEVYIETVETFAIKRDRTFIRVWCEDCKREVSMLPPREAALLMGHDMPAIYSMMANRRIGLS